MHTMLMNFGDNIRVICDSQNNNFSVDIGAVLEADVHPVHLGMIQRSIASETLIVVDDETLKYSTDRFQMIMSVLRDIDGEDYDSVLERFNLINGPNPDSLRPTRDMVRIACRELARQEVRKMMAARAKVETEAALAANRVTIHEQGDDRTRVEVEPPGSKQPKVEEPPAEKPKKKKAAKTVKKPVVKAKKKIVRVRL